MSSVPPKGRGRMLSNPIRHKMPADEFADTFKNPTPSTYAKFMIDGLERDIAVGRYISRRELIHTLSFSVDYPLPATVVEFICKYINGDIPQKEKHDSKITDLAQMICISIPRYETAMLQFKNARANAKPDNAKRNEFTPAQKALRFVFGRKLKSAEEFQNLQNSISKARKIIKDKNLEAVVQRCKQALIEKSPHDALRAQQVEMLKLIGSRQLHS